MVRRRIGFAALAYMLAAMTLWPSMQWCGASWAEMRLESYAPCAVACAGTGTTCEPASSCDLPSQAPCEPSASCGPTDCERPADDPTASGKAWCPTGLFAGMAAAKSVDDDATPLFTPEPADFDPPAKVAVSTAPLLDIVRPRDRASPPPPIRGPPST